MNNFKENYLHVCNFSLERQGLTLAIEIPSKDCCARLDAGNANGPVAVFPVYSSASTKYVPS